MKALTCATERSRLSAIAPLWAGAFSGAAQAKPGSFEMVRGGTVFLDEAGACPRLLPACNPMPAGRSRSPRLLVSARTERSLSINQPAVPADSAAHRVMVAY